MHVNVEIPEISPSNCFDRYWLGLIFQNNSPSAYQIRALLSEYMRLVQASLKAYGSGRDHVLYFWKLRRPEEIPLGAMQAAITQYETCITGMHRAIRVLRSLRSRIDTPAHYKTEVLTKPSFIADDVAERIRKARDAIQHMDEKLFKGEIPENTPFSLMPDGPEVPMPPEPGQTLKTIDRLTIGVEVISFGELHEWLREMSKYAEAISLYDFTKAPS